jgi:hypothetical protein
MYILNEKPEVVFILGLGVRSSASAADIAQNLVALGSECSQL